jgi:hypothetical protein
MTAKTLLSMLLLSGLGLALAGCVVAPAYPSYGNGYDSGYYYGGPAYYGPSVGFYYGGGGGRGWDRDHGGWRR